ncbi:hypothetical protein IQ235_09420 [Oscillatoriales cyanobacterium LEGE 11467]|uniref:Uncharacterized protein n=1 Tax=Zarconia navalis LEGE 11467 TaxID=1828826 RepID=A0A928VXB6_9CYAN|nr:hypothetical protein [Zarconia navalis]MBE9040998.1 hypothetical protein [Zarconia navalis LEGE 11467]
MPAKKSVSKTAAERAKKAVDKVNSGRKSKSKSTKSKSSAIANTPQGRELTVNGLSDLTPDNVSESVPAFEPTNYNISDPLAPSESMPRVTDEQHDRNRLIYKETQNALDSVGLAMDTSKKRFETIGKQAKAIGAGIDAATTINETKGKAVKYRTSEELLEQEFLKLDIAGRQTTTATQVRDYAYTSLDEDIEQARIRSEIAAAKSNKLESDLKALTSGLSLPPAQ